MAGTTSRQSDAIDRRSQSERRSKMDGGARVNSCRKSKQMILDREGWSSSVLSVLVVPASNKCKRHCQEATRESVILK
jgi:hypothetical protein